MSKFILINHLAFKAGNHQDLRFQIPGRKKSYDSFAISKGVPLNSGTKVIAIRTTIHTEKEAYFTGTIQKGFYGGGTLEMLDQGECDILTYKPNHIKIIFYGNKIKGLYHLMHFEKMPEKMYIIFKSKEEKQPIIKTNENFNIQDYLNTLA